MDTKAGEVDTWPAHASGLGLSSSAAMLSKNKSLVILSEEDSGKAPIIPKPRFLEQLENFLQKELRALGVTEVAPSDLRLQVSCNGVVFRLPQWPRGKVLLPVFPC